MHGRACAPASHGSCTNSFSLANRSEDFIFKKDANNIFFKIDLGSWDLDYELYGPILFIFFLYFF